MDDDTALIVAELMLKSHAAQRDAPRIGDEEHPTPWDLDHRRIDELLDRLHGAEARSA